VRVDERRDSAGTASQFTMSIDSATRSVTCGPTMCNAEHRPAALGGDDLHDAALADDVRLADALEVEDLDVDLVAALDGLAS